MAKFNSVAEQLKSKESKFVLGVVTTAKSKVFKRWKAIDNAITDALNEVGAVTWWNQMHFAACLVHSVLRFCCCVFDLDQECRACE